MAFNFQTVAVRKYMFVFLVIALALSAATVRHISSAAVSASKVEEKRITPQPQGQSDLVATVRVFIHPEDLYPDTVVVKPGKLRLVAENQTLSDVSLVVERVIPGPSQRVAAVKTVNHGKRTRQDVTLGAGEYVFYEETRPQRQGRIIVDPNTR